MKKYRNEWKYCCTDSEIDLLKSRLKNLLQLDPYSKKEGNYYVHSLYFDDYKDNCAKKNESGFDRRFKWRIRYYGDSPNIIKLEKKEKIAGRCHKKTTKLTIEQYKNLLKDNVSKVFWETEDDLIKCFCKDIMTKRFMPKVIIDYERIAFIEPITNVRITLDQNITASYDFDNFLKGGYQKFPLQDKNQSVLEVKFDYVLPGSIKKIICSYFFKQTSFSKYFIGRKKMEEVLK